MMTLISVGGYHYTCTCTFKVASKISMPSGTSLEGLGGEWVWLDEEEEVEKVGEVSSEYTIIPT